MKYLSESELILNRNGSVYHLNLLPENISDTIITVGDPDRVTQVSKHFDSIEFKTRKREFATHTGTYRGKRISVISSGIGTDNVEILMNELDILANVNLKTRTVKEEKKQLKIIRIGTSGSIRREISIGSHVVSVNAIGMDSLTSFYNLSQSNFETDICASFQASTNIICQPYFTQGSIDLIKIFGNGMYQGNTLTCPGFYASQGRELRVRPVISNFVEKISAFQNSGFVLANLEMETAGYYAMGRILEHEVLSLNVILGNRIDNTFTKKPKRMIDGLIELTLSRL